MGARLSPPVKNHIDVAALIAVLTLMLLGLGVVYSASSAHARGAFGEAEGYLVKHAIKVGIALAVLFLVMKIDYRRWMKLSKPALLAACGLLLLTLFIGITDKGASRSLDVAGFGLQPSEFAKYALLFHLCTLLTLKNDVIRNFKRGYLPMLFWVCIVVGLVMAQPNYSMGMVIFLLGLLVLFLGGVRLTHLALTGAVLVPILAAYLMSADYRVERVNNYIRNLEGNVDPQKSHQLYQALIAYGNGGIFGRGPGESMQREYFLPEPYGDFVFSIVGEEYGIIGTVFFMLLFLLILHRGLRIASHAPDRFGQLLALAVTCTITGFALVHAGVTLGLLPTTGLPMPFVSFGGSAMIFSAAAVGVLLNISSQGDLHPRATQVPVTGEVSAGGSRREHSAGRPVLGKVY